MPLTQILLNTLILLYCGEPMIVFFLYLFLQCNDSPEALELIHAYPVEGIEGVQLSGLTMLDGKILTISDKHDNFIFQIDLKKEAAELSVVREIGSPIAGKLDLEGITCEANGTVYLLSESQNRVLKLDPEMKEPAWVTPSFTDLGNKKGLLQSVNAGFEGLVFVPPDLFVAAAERQGRGLISWLKSDTADILVKNCDSSRFFPSRHRTLDFTGLFFFRGKLVVLQRDNFLISVISGYRHGEFQEKQAWSYEHVENDLELRYSDRRFGLAEGLCIDEDHVYLVLDNNGDGREKDPLDHRPLLLVFKKPACL